MLAIFKRALVRDTRAGVAEDGARIGLARARRLADGTPSLAACAFRIDDGAGHWLDRADARLEQLDLRHAAATLVLHDQSYQLLMVETPNVPADEMSRAMRWRVKDLIDYPVDEAVVEVFDMPRHANAASKAMSHAVVARRATLRSQVERMREQQLALEAIDIPELCLRNIATGLSADQDGLAFLHFSEDCGYLIVTRQGVLYVTRRIEIGRQAFSDGLDRQLLEERAAAIALQVQRSLDYYESHFDARPIRELVVGPGAGIDEVVTALVPNLELGVSVLDLEEIAELEHELSREEAGVCLLAIGAALRDAASDSRAVAA